MREITNINKELNKKLNNILSNYNIMTITCDDEKEILSQEILELIHDIKRKQKDLCRKQKHEDIRLIDEFIELENMLKTLEEKIQRYNY